MGPESSSSRRTALCALTGLAALALAAGCAIFEPRTVTLSQSQLQSLMERQFPRQQRLLEIFDISLSSPVIRMQPDRNRMATAFDLSARERVTGRALRGSLALDHGLRYEPSDATLRLVNVRVDNMQLELAGTPLGGQVARLGALLTEQLLDDVVIYRVNDEKRLALARAGVNNADVAVTSRGLELRFTTAR
jgi:hypothetical protein